MKFSDLYKKYPNLEHYIKLLEQKYKVLKAKQSAYDIKTDDKKKEELLILINQTITNIDQFLLELDYQSYDVAVLNKKIEFLLNKTDESLKIIEAKEKKIYKTITKEYQPSTKETVDLGELGKVNGAYYIDYFVNAYKTLFSKVDDFPDDLKKNIEDLTNKYLLLIERVKKDGLGKADNSLVILKNIKTIYDFLKKLNFFDKETLILKYQLSYFDYIDFYNKVKKQRQKEKKQNNDNKTPSNIIARLQGYNINSILEITYNTKLINVFDKEYANIKNLINFEITEDLIQRLDLIDKVARVFIDAGSLINVLKEGINKIGNFYLRILSQVDDVEVGQDIEKIRKILNKINNRDINLNDVDFDIKSVSIYGVDVWKKIIIAYIETIAFYKIAQGFKNVGNITVGKVLKVYKYYQPTLEFLATLLSLAKISSEGKQISFLSLENPSNITDKITIDDFDKMKDFLDLLQKVVDLPQDIINSTEFQLFLKTFNVEQDNIIKLNDKEKNKLLDFKKDIVEYYSKDDIEFLKEKLSKGFIDIQKVNDKFLDEGNKLLDKNQNLFDDFDLDFGVVRTENPNIFKDIFSKEEMKSLEYLDDYEDENIRQNLKKLEEEGIKTFSALSKKRAEVYTNTKYNFFYTKDGLLLYGYLPRQILWIYYNFFAWVLFYLTLLIRAIENLARIEKIDKIGYSILGAILVLLGFKFLFDANFQTYILNHFNNFFTINPAWIDVPQLDLLNVISYLFFLITWFVLSLFIVVNISAKKIPQLLVAILNNDRRTFLYVKEIFFQTILLIFLLILFRLGT